MLDVLLRSGWQVKTRWVGYGVSTLWQWGNFYESLDEAVAYKTKSRGYAHPIGRDNWKLEIEIFRIERYEG